MVHFLHLLARWVLGSAILIWVGIHGVAGATPARGVDVALYVAMATALLVLLATAEPLRSRRYTLHAGRRTGVPAIWLEPPQRSGRSKRRLRKRALAAERGIRELLAEFERDARRQLPHWGTVPNWDALTEDEKHEVFAAAGQKSMERHTEFMIEYHQRFASEALALRELFEARGIADESSRAKFEHPTNTYVVERVAQFLGTWARNL